MHAEQINWLGHVLDCLIGPTGTAIAHEDVVALNSVSASAIVARPSSFLMTRQGAKHNKSASL
jgi:methionine-rich copper-binding protein CopC